MRKSRFNEEQIMGILAEQERGLTTAQVCRKHNVSSATFYKWKAKFGGMDVSPRCGETAPRLNIAAASAASHPHPAFNSRKRHPRMRERYCSGILDRK